MYMRISSWLTSSNNNEAECEKLRMERDLLKQLHLTCHPQQQQDGLLPTPMEMTQELSYVNSNFYDIYYNIHNIHIATNNTSTGSGTAPNNFNYFENFTSLPQNNTNNN